MNYHQLLQQRLDHLGRARLANVAFAFDRLADFAGRLARTGVTGPLTLHPVDPEAERYCPALVAHASSQAVIDEHFVDEDVADFSDVLDFLEDEGLEVEWTFRHDDLVTRWLPRLRVELECAGVIPPAVPPTLEDSRHGGEPDADTTRNP